MERKVRYLESLQMSSETKQHLHDCGYYTVDDVFEKHAQLDRRLNMADRLNLHFGFVRADIDDSFLQLTKAPPE